MIILPKVVIVGLCAVACASSGAYGMIASNGNPSITPETLVPIGAVGASVIILIALAFKAGKWEQRMSSFDDRLSKVEELVQENTAHKNGT